MQERLGGKQTSDRENIAGQVERVTYHAAESGFCVLQVKVRGRRELATVIGHAPSIGAGEFVSALGRWTVDTNYGHQFRADRLRATPPTTKEGIEKYLGSGMIKGIGPIYARKLVDGFGSRVFDVIERSPERLREVDGIGPKRAGQITAGWSDQKAVREIMLFLHSHGVGTARAVRIYKTYGVDAIERIRENPYCLARDVRGIGFRSADTIAGALGIAPDAIVRRRAGIRYALEESLGRGHCALPTRELTELAATLLEVTPSSCEEALALELEEGGVTADTIAGTPCIFLTRLHGCEREIAEAISRIAAERPSWAGIDPSLAIPWAEKATDIELSQSQRAALETALSSNIVVVTGGPGTGKTTLINTLLAILSAKSVRVFLCAPTGRAAKRLAQASGAEARTIHRLLEVDPRHGGFKRNADNPLPCDLAIVDETSMVDVPLMASLVRAVEAGTGIFFVGDTDQLPSVGPGSVLGDLIASGAVPVARLDHVFRQAARSLIVQNAHRVHEGRMPQTGPRPECDFHIVEAEPEDVPDLLVAAVKRRIPERFGFDPVRDVQVLCPMNRGGSGARALNVVLQEELNAASGPSVDRFGFTFRPGDKVIQTENDYDKDVYNGDVGVVRDVDPDEQELHVEFEDRSVTYDFSELDRLSLAYATSVHKAQGSEYPAVVVPITTQHFPMLKRNLLYTAITRGRRLVVLIGQRKAIAIAVKNVGAERRWSKLAELLGPVAE